MQMTLYLQINLNALIEKIIYALISSTKLEYFSLDKKILQLNVNYSLVLVKYFAMLIMQ